MLVFKVAAVCLLALAVRADKKIELQDIEEDNLKSEKESDNEKADSGAQNPNQGLTSLDFLKNGLLRYFENAPTPQPRYVQQYAVTEPPEKAPPVISKPEYGAPDRSSQTQQAMVGYLSNVPMQIYLVPQYYNDHGEQATNVQPNIQYVGPNNPAGRSIYNIPEVQQQADYVEAYVAPSAQAYLPQYNPDELIQNTPRNVLPKTHMTVVASPPIYPYAIPLSHYANVGGPQQYHHKGYYVSGHHGTDTNAIEQGQENAVDNPNQYANAHSETNYVRNNEYPRYYSSRNHVREEQRLHPVAELPPPNPVLFRNQPSHLAHLPKALPMYRPISKPVYAAGGGALANAISPRPSDAYGAPYRKRPASLLDSYIPSSVQLEYLKRGYSKDPMSVYDALSSGRHFPHPVTPRYYERGFLPNQMYHTAAGGVTYGHHKRAPKQEKHSQT